MKIVEKINSILKQHANSNKQYCLHVVVRIKLSEHHEQRKINVNQTHDVVFVHCHKQQVKEQEFLTKYFQTIDKSNAIVLEYLSIYSFS